MRELHIFTEFGKSFKDVDIDDNKFIDKDEFMAWWEHTGAGV